MNPVELLRDLVAIDSTNPTLDLRDYERCIEALVATAAEFCSG